MKKSGFSLGNLLDQLSEERINLVVDSSMIKAAGGECGTTHYHKTHSHCDCNCDCRSGSTSSGSTSGSTSLLGSATGTVTGTVGGIC